MIRSLSDRRSFQRLRSNGVRRGKGPIRITHLHAPGQSAHVAFAIPRSVGGAVVRNRIRRRIKAVLREIASPEPESLPGGDYLIRVTSPLERFDHDALKGIIQELVSDGRSS